MQRLGRIGLVLAVVAITSNTALAQEQQRRQRGGFGGRFGGGVVFLLGQKSVQEELKLTDEQVKKVKELSEKQRESFRGQRGQRDEETRKKIEEARQATDKAVAELLRLEQLKRVKQISLQQQGARSLSNPEVASALKLTDEQVNKIKSIQEETRTARGGQRGQRDEQTRKKLEETRKATNEKLMNVLTDEQKAKWKELTGEPFKGEIARPQFGGRTRNRSESNP